MGVKVGSYLDQQPAFQVVEQLKLPERSSISSRDSSTKSAAVANYQVSVFGVTKIAFLSFLCKNYKFT
jgi:hypothetical protein